MATLPKVLISRADYQIGGGVALRLRTQGSHVPMLSNPALVLDVIRKAANAVQTATVSG